MQKSYGKYSSGKVVYQSTGAFECNYQREMRTRDLISPSAFLTVFAFVAIVVTLLAWGAGVI